MILASSTPQSDGLDLIAIAMVIFMVVFVLIVLWVVFARSGAFRKQSEIPLRDDEVVEPRDTDKTHEGSAS